MKRVLIPLMVTGLIVFRLVTYSLMDGTYNNPMRFLLRLYEGSDAVSHITIGTLIAFMYNKKENCHYRWFLACGIAFCFMLSLLELYVFLPVCMSSRIRFISDPVFDVFSYLSTALILYFFICSRNNLLK